MYVREKKRKTKKGLLTYAYLVDHRWNPLQKKYEQKLIHSLGRVDELPAKGTVEKIILALDKYAAKKGFTSIRDGVILKDLNDRNILDKVYDFGEYQLVNHVLSSLSLNEIIRNVFKGQKDKKISEEKLLFALTAQIAYHLHSFVPHSELAINRWYQDKLFLKGKPELNLMVFYRALDVLIDHKDEIEREYFNRNTDLFTGGLDFVLFDTTSIYYYDGEEQVTNRVNDPKLNVKADLLQYGFSKDGKGNLKQVIVGSLMSRTGVPLAHETFPGNTSDQISFPEIIKKVKSKYQLERIIFVADRGMVSEKNLTHLEEENLEYILGVKMKKLSPIIKSSVLPVDMGQMDKVGDNLYVTDFPLSNLPSKEQDDLIDHFYEDLDKKVEIGKDYDQIRQEIKERIVKRRMIIAFNPQMAAVEKDNRKYFTNIIKHKLKDKTKKSWFIKNGYSKYLKVDELKLSLNEEKLKQEELYDGVWILITNCGSIITPQTLASAYKSLSFVEQGFHDLKSMVNIRPIYHFTERRIKAHIFLSWLTLVVKWYTLNQINSSTHKDGLRFIEEMLSLKAVAVDSSIPLYLRTVINEQTIEYMGQLKMKIPSRIIIDGRVKSAILPVGRGRPKKNLNQEKLPLIS